MPYQAARQCTIPGALVGTGRARNAAMPRALQRDREHTLTGSLYVAAASGSVCRLAVRVGFAAVWQPSLRGLSPGAPPFVVGLAAGSCSGAVAHLGHARTAL